jgi:hypothetical protein
MKHHFNHREKIFSPHSHIIILGWNYLIISDVRSSVKSVNVFFAYLLMTSGNTEHSTSQPYIFRLHELGFSSTDSIFFHSLCAVFKQAGLTKGSFCFGRS